MDFKKVKEMIEEAVAKGVLRAITKYHRVTNPGDLWLKLDEAALLCNKSPEWFRKAVRNGLYFRGSVPRSVVDEWYWKAEKHSLRFNAEGEALATDLDAFRAWFEELQERTTEKKAA